MNIYSDVVGFNYHPSYAYNSYEEWRFFDSDVIDETSGADLFNTTELQKRMSTHLSAIPVEVCATLVQGIVDNWETFGAFGNKLEAMEFLSHLISLQKKTKSLLCSGI